MKISLAPLQGYTDWVFRRAYQKYIGGVDEFYTPFLVLQNGGDLKTAHKREVEPFSEKSDNLIPQFLCGSVEEMSFFESYFSDLGYSKMNWNLGCPYPMVTKRGKGSGLLPYPEKIGNIITEGFKDKIELSIKMRLGLTDENEIHEVLKALDQFNIKEIIIHPRIGKQLYKGTANREKFAQLYNEYGKKFAYNGDINSCQDFEVLSKEISCLNHLMIGRGILKDFWLPHKIKGLELPTDSERKIILKKVHDEIYETYSSYLSGDNQVLQKVKPFWEYFSCHFETERKVYKAIKKASGLKKYEQAVSFAFGQNLKVD